jgi:hypothetical protein
MREICIYLNINEDKLMLQAFINHYRIILKNKLKLFEKNVRLFILLFIERL